MRVMYNMCTMIPALPVYLDVKTFEALGGEPEGTEQDMLDIAFEPYKTWKVMKSTGSLFIMCGYWNTSINARLTTRYRYNILHTCP